MVNGLFIIKLVCLLAITSFANQFESNGQKLQFEKLTQRSDVVWGFDFIDSEQIILSERSGSILILNISTRKVTEVTGGPKVHSGGQGGLLDIRVAPDFSKSKKVFISYSKPTGKMASTALAVATLDNAQLMGLKDVIVTKSESENTIHYGSRIEFDNQGHLFLSVGDRNERERAQSLEWHNGKILRIKLDGSVPQDNPFVTHKNARPEIWSLGHRNPQGLAYDQSRQELWECEFGPRGGDELNLIRPGANYGWPIVTYGREYWGPKIGEGTVKAGMQAPVEYWVPSISPSAIAIYRSDKIPKWQGHLFLANLSSMHLRRLEIKDGKVSLQEGLLHNLKERIRNVRAGPDGALYISTDGGLVGRITHLK